MTNPTPADGRATLVRSYRNMSEREIRRRLQGPLSEAERVTARAELLRREDNGPDTTFVTGFAPTGALDFGSVESQPAPEVLAESDGADSEPPRAARRVWPIVFVLVVAITGIAGWALHAGLIRL